MSDKPKKQLDRKDLLIKLQTGLQALQRYAVVVFLLFIAMLYGFLLLRISNLSGEQPSADAVTSQVQAAQIPHIEQSVVDQLNSLQNNSVSVQSLFNQERSNPFQ